MLENHNPGKEVGQAFQPDLQCLCSSGKVRLESRATIRDDSPVGADGPVMEIKPCLEAALSIYAGLPSSTISAVAA